MGFVQNAGMTDLRIKRRFYYLTSFERSERGKNGGIRCLEAFFID